MKIYSNNHRGQMSQTVALILIIMGAIILMLFANKFVSKSSTEESITGCRYSVMTQVATELKPGIRGWSSPFDIDCDKRYIEFYNTQVKLGLSLENMNAQNIVYESEQSKRFNELNNFIVNQVVAEEMRICWYQFGEGKVKVFVNNEKTLQDKVCFVCTEISFEKSVKRDKFTGLIDYLNSTRMDKFGMTYYSYFNQATVSEHNWEEFNSLPKNIVSMFKPDFIQNGLNKNIKYYVIFLKDYDWLSTDGYYVELVPAEDINKICDIQAS